MTGHRPGYPQGKKTQDSGQGGIVSELDLASEDLFDRDTGRTRRITGYLIGRISTKMGAPDQRNTEPKARWSDNRVWKLRSGSYALVRESWSRTYHTHPTRCKTVDRIQSGTRTTAGEMFDELEDMGFGYTEDAVRCERCQPDWPEDLAGDDVIRFEFVRRSIEQFPHPGQVIKALTHIPKFGGAVEIVVSGPVKGLLEQCQVNDPDWNTGADDEEQLEHIG
jgi:hypothetical protein